MPQEWVKTYPEAHKNLLEWENRTYQEILDEYFSDPEIKVVLCGFVSYLGARPYNTPASTVVLYTFGYFFSGGYQVLGTPQRFAEMLAASIKKNGGDVLCNNPVDKILVDRKGAKGVQVGKKEFLAPIVVCNINPKTTTLISSIQMSFLQTSSRSCGTFLLETLLLPSILLSMILLIPTLP